MKSGQCVCFATFCGRGSGLSYPNGFQKLRIQEGKKKDNLQSMDLLINYVLILEHEIILL